jgi:hypothetical protein
MRRLHSHEWEHLLKTKDDELAARDQTIKDLGFQLGMAEEGLANYAQELARAQSVNAEFHNLDDVAEIRRLEGERASAIDRLTPLGCELTELRAVLEKAVSQFPNDDGWLNEAKALLWGDSPESSSEPQSEQRSITEESK